MLVSIFKRFRKTRWVLAFVVGKSHIWKKMPPIFNGNYDLFMSSRITNLNSAFRSKSDALLQICF